MDATRPQAMCMLEASSRGAQRLIDAGITRLISPEGIEAAVDDIKGVKPAEMPQWRADALFISAELLRTPWSLTRSFHRYTMGDRLALRGPADPSGCGEGYSYTLLPPKKADADGDGARGASGVQKGRLAPQSDLRKLKLDVVVNMLRPYGYTREAVQVHERVNVGSHAISE